MVKAFFNGIVTKVDNIPEQQFKSRIISAHKVIVIEDTETNNSGQIITNEYEIAWFGNSMAQLDIGENVSLLGANVTCIAKMSGRRNDKGYMNYQFTGKELIVNSFSHLETPSEEEKATRIPQKVAPTEADISEDNLPFNEQLSY